MRTAKLTILAALSLVMVAVLAWGYVGVLSLEIFYVSWTPSVDWIRGGQGGVTRGQLYVEWYHHQVSDTFTDLTGVVSPLRPTLGLQVHPRCAYQPFAARAWGFDINRFAPLPGDDVVRLLCPLWFAALPFTIAPIAWLRRRRRREARGFPIETPAQGESCREGQTL